MKILNIVNRKGGASRTLSKLSQHDRTSKRNGALR